MYSWLLRLYPSHFRKAFGDAALQLFRDRYRDETGFFPRLRLWIDLLNDLAISLPHEHRRVPRTLVGASAQHQSYAPPTFYLFSYEAPCLRSLLSAGMLSLVTFGLLPFSIAHGGGTPPSTQFPADSAKIDAAERQRVLDTVINNIKQYYFDPRAAREITNVLLAHEKRGEYDSLVDGQAYANLLTRQLRNVSRDMHLEVVYSDDPIPDHPPEPTPAVLARYRRALERNNCTFETVKIFPQNIGYLKLNSFPDPSICQSTAKAAMGSLNRADAIIFDLRDNRGGSGEMVSLIAGYLFDHPEFLYDPRTSPTPQSWTRPVPGSRLVDKPAYILTSASTASAAEQFTYDLKALKRATLVGETTSGNAHAGVFHRIDDHFGMGIPRTKAINPFSKADWEAVGIEPDVKTNPADALATAQKLAANRLKR
jgi:hypothetical protein